MAVVMKKFKGLFRSEAGENYASETGKIPPPEEDYYFIEDIYQDISEIHQILNYRVIYFGKKFIRLDLLTGDYLFVSYDMDKLAREVECARNSELNFKMN